MGSARRQGMVAPRSTFNQSMGAHRSQGEYRRMSEKHPECPLYNPLNCKEYYNPKLCAFVRRDKACLKKKKPKSKESSKDRSSFQA
jgi:hypothetical protein